MPTSPEAALRVSRPWSVSCRDIFCTCQAYLVHTLGAYLPRYTHTPLSEQETFTAAMERKMLVSRLCPFDPRLDAPVKKERKKKKKGGKKERDILRTIPRYTLHYTIGLSLGQTGGTRYRSSREVYPVSTCVCSSKVLRDKRVHRGCCSLPGIVDRGKGWDGMGRLLGTACVRSAAKSRVVDDRNGRAWYLPHPVCWNGTRNRILHVYRLQSMLFGSWSSVWQKAKTVRQKQISTVFRIRSIELNSIKVLNRRRFLQYSMRIRA